MRKNTLQQNYDVTIDTTTRQPYNEAKSVKKARNVYADFKSFYNRSSYICLY